MMNKGSLNINLETLKKIAPERLQQQPVTAVLLALGSNHQAEHYLSRVRKKLQAIGEVQLSTAFQNPDFTATVENTKPDYTNQCVYLHLNSVMTLQQLQHNFKSFEGDCNRQREIATTTIRQATIRQVNIRQVTMDIDILLIKLEGNNNISSNEWIIMADRYPFKAHESTGVMELVGFGL